MMSGAVSAGNSRNRRHARTQTLLSHISETSYYEEHSAGITIDNTLEFLGNSNTKGSFRDGVEVDIPCIGDISSIQPTPNSAYTGESYWSKLGSGPSVHNRSPAIGSSFHDDHPGTFRLQPAVLARKLVWPWFKGRVISIKSAAEKFGKAAKITTRAGGLPSLSSVQASLHEKTPDTSLVSSSIPDFPSPPQGAKRPIMAKHRKPVTRRAVGTGRIVIPRERLVSTKAELVYPTVSSHKQQSDNEKKQPSPTPSFDHTPRRNSLGISYTDMLSNPNSPFHASSTWSTIPSSHEWHDETIQSFQSLNENVESGSGVLPPPGASSGGSLGRSRSVSQPNPNLAANWAPFKDSLSDINNNNDAASSTTKYPQSQWSFTPIPRPQPLPENNNKWASATRSANPRGGNNPRFKSRQQPIALVTASQSKTSSDFAVYI